MAALPHDTKPTTAQGEPPVRLAIDFENSIRYLITSLANKINIAGSREMQRRHGIGLMEWRVLALLGAEGEATPGRIAQVAGVDKSVVSRAVGSLERRGLVTVMADEFSGRQTRLRFTAAGSALHDRGITYALKAEAILLEGLSDADRQVMRRLLKQMIANLPALNQWSG